MPRRNPHHHPQNDRVSAPVPIRVDPVPPGRGGTAMKVLLRDQDLSDDFVRFAAQIGADGFDIHTENNVPGVVERGYADERGMRALLDRLRRWGLGVYRVSPPTPARYLLGLPGGDEELDHLCRTLEALGRAGVPIMSTPVHLVHLGSNQGYRGFV